MEIFHISNMDSLNAFLIIGLTSITHSVTFAYKFNVGHHQQQELDSVPCVVDIVKHYLLIEKYSGSVIVINFPPTMSIFSNALAKAIIEKSNYPTSIVTKYAYDKAYHTGMTVQQWGFTFKSTSYLLIIDSTGEVEPSLRHEFLFDSVFRS